MALWLVGTTYSQRQAVTGSDGVAYTSLINGNVGHDPTLQAGYVTCGRYSSNIV
jgi:hypothetical protein